MRFDEQLLQAQRQLQKTQEALYLTIGLENKCQFDSAYQEALRFALEAEKLTLLARDLPAYTGHPKAREMVSSIIEENIPVETEFTPEGWFRLSFPAMLPRKERGNCSYVRGFLYPAMQRFSEHNNNPRREFNDSVIIFRHVYGHKRPERLFRDHDNIEVNAVVDILALYLLRSDSPIRLAHHYCSAQGEADGTEVYIVERKDFIRFLIALNSGKIGAKEVENLPP